jgi:hypothetical protein
VWPGYQACRTNIKVAEAWAAKPHSHLGRFQPKTMMVVHLESTAERDSQINKNRGATGSQALAPFHFAPFTSHTSAERKTLRDRRWELALTPPARPLTSVRAPRG